MKKLYKYDFALIIIAILIGIVVAILASIYADFVNLLQNNLYKKFIDSYLIIVIPAIGGLLVGLLLKNDALSAKGHGIPAILQTIKTKEIYFNFYDLLIEGFASALTIGTGGSAGRIGPLVEIGTGMADLIDQKLDFPEDLYQTILGCGAAAGISAVFHAPLGGIVFVMELLFRDLKLERVTLVIISAVSANIFARNIFEIEPLFNLPAFFINSFWEYPLFIILGFIIGFIGFLFVKGLYLLSINVEKFKVPIWLKPALGGLIVGLTGFFLPQILGTGIEITNEFLLNDFSLKLLLLMVIFKLIMTIITLASGGSGGVFAPILMIGALTGAIFAYLGKIFFGEFLGLTISYGVIGMAASFAAISQAPFTSALIIFELTGNYNIIVPLLLTSVISTTIYNKFMKESVYSPKLFRRLDKKNK